jgi:hypothetical protein
MASGWSTKRVLITVRTYPVPATKGFEVSCTAAISDDGKWIRLFPVPYRLLPPDKRFTKYQWIEVSLLRAKGDPRPESHHLNIETIKLGETVSPARQWAARKAILKPLIRPSLCAIQKERDDKGAPTLGLFKPARIKRLLIVANDADWTAKQKAILSQKTLGFEKVPRGELEKIPFDFYYEFVCDHSGCRGHKMGCTDWEMAEAYRQWRKKYGDRWEAEFRKKFERDMISKFDTHFYVGTLHQHPKNWMIVGLFYPPPTEPDLFS